ncbi:MAG: hypothetical protein KDB22_12890 [Planctomycetales bacterium]|nr:hypothetical protein [Planctomycetales bacterium]
MDYNPPYGSKDGFVLGYHSRTQRVYLILAARSAVVGANYGCHDTRRQIQLVKLGVSQVGDFEKNDLRLISTMASPIITETWESVGMVQAFSGSIKLLGGQLLGP